MFIACKKQRKQIGTQQYFCVRELSWKWEAGRRSLLPVREFLAENRNERAGQFETLVNVKPLRPAESSPWTQWLQSLIPN